MPSKKVEVCEDKLYVLVGGLLVKVLKACHKITYVRSLWNTPWTSLYMDGTAVKFFFEICPHEAGSWDPNYTPGVNFLDQNFLSAKSSG